MPRVTFDELTKSYGDVQVLQPFSAAVGDGEFLVLLGPSGCGKSTLLRMIAGLADITSGTIAFDDQVVNDWDVRRRDIAFVFQSYALYPQMTVRQNIAFPLLMDRMSAWQHLPGASGITRHRLMRKPELADAVERIAERMELTALLERRPAALSGGQRQRVALARSLVRDPAMYLLDEPLSNLDAKLRTQMRADISRLHRTVGKTFVYVTHDQVEAMTMATRIIVMDHGRIQQIGTPDEIYDRPANTFVATFVGTPPMNLLDGALLAQHPESGIGSAVARLTVGVRPEHVALASPHDDGLAAEVDAVERVGAETLVSCRVAGPETTVVARVQGVVRLSEGDHCRVRFDGTTISRFSLATGDRVESDTTVLAA